MKPNLSLALLLTDALNGLLRPKKFPEYYY